MELNHIFLFLAVVSPIAVLVRNSKSHPGDESWRIAAGVVLAVTGFAWMVFREHAGYIGGGAWFALLFLPAVGLKRMTELAGRHQYTSAKKLAALLQWLHPSAHLRDQIRLFQYLENRQLAGNLPPPIENVNQGLSARIRRLRHTPAVTTLITANILVFGIELLFDIQLLLGADGPNESEVLLKLGALRPAWVLLRHEYWRLFTALFLHASIIHLLFNLFALYVLGPAFERTIGSLRFVACYLLAGICSAAGIVILWRLGIVARNAEVVGASGCIMGIVGAWAAFLIKDRHMPLARRRLMNILMIVVIQTIFDRLTPQVSMAAHLCGLAGGFLVGFAVTRRSSSHQFERRPSWSG
ncbi:MAG TPA: rhomboid family intramembrane serine protease [Chthoniobacterales bacterium]